MKNLGEMGHGLLYMKMGEGSKGGIRMELDIILD